jgi:phospholipid/cholesterol/gamma-HCH transport system ATP-binding protein
MEELNQQEQAIYTAQSEEGLIIRAEHVSKAFGTHHVLRDINLEVKHGENVVVLGKSGSGKSVLIKCMVGLIQPDAGVLEVLGRNVTDLDDEGLNEIRKDVGFLFQSAALYDSMTVRENLEFPLRRNSKHAIDEHNIDELVEEALDNVGLLEAIDKMPSELSGGMRKRIGLARTFILKPKIMLYDEPTTGLDPVTSHEISELILRLQKKYNTTSIIITHDMPCAKATANRVVVLREGKFVANGTYDELENSSDAWVRAFFENAQI